MPTYRYELVIVEPDEVDQDTQEAIGDTDQEHDRTPEARTRRFLGDYVDDAESNLSVALPDGWFATISEAS